MIFRNIIEAIKAVRSIPVHVELVKEFIANNEGSTRDVMVARPHIGLKDAKDIVEAIMAMSAERGDTIKVKTLEDKIKSQDDYITRIDTENSNLHRKLNRLRDVIGECNNEYQMEDIKF